MRDTSRTGQALIVLSALLFAGSAAAGTTSAQRCEADKVKTTGKHESCQMKAHSKFVRTGDAAKLTSSLFKCDAKITDKFNSAELRWGLECPTVGDLASIQARVTQDTDDLGILLSGGTLSPVCGNGAIETGEDCDFGNHDGETCDSLTAGAEPYGALACTQGSCIFDTSGCVPRFEDTGLTVIDHETDLEWEKKTGTLGVPSACPGGANCADPHDVNNLYTWSIVGQLYDGTIRTEYLDVLNDVAGGGANCFAGHCDWRTPTVAKPDEYGVVDEGEWESIVDCSGGAPCIDSTFGPTASDDYWSATANYAGLWATWIADFLDDSTTVSSKANALHVRAVRGGS